MKSDKQTHWFNITLPKIKDDEEEIFWRHPVHPLQCNQIGLIYLDEGYDVRYQDGKKEVIAYRPTIRTKGEYDWIEAGHPLRVMFECWWNRQVKYSAFVFRDGNPLNTTQGNLVRKGEADPQEWKMAYMETQEFRIRSLQYMRSRDVIITGRGIDPKDYWTALGVPVWLRQMYFKDNPEDVKAIRGAYIKKIEATQLMQRIVKLKEKGNSLEQIRLILNLSTRKRVQYWLKKAQQLNDI